MCHRLKLDEKKYRKTFMNTPVRSNTSTVYKCSRLLKKRSAHIRVCEQHLRPGAVICCVWWQRRWVIFDPPPEGGVKNVHFLHCGGPPREGGKFAPGFYLVLYILAGFAKPVISCRRDSGRTPLREHFRSLGPKIPELAKIGKKGQK